MGPLFLFAAAGDAVGFESSIAHESQSVNKFAYTYVSRFSDGKLYVGSTTDLKRRIKEQEGGLVPATS